MLQVWDGLVWTASKDHPIFTELGGGAWQVLPGLRASMWRVLADPAPGGHGVGISEITFYRNPDCTDPIHASIPNIMPICSGYATSREIGDKTGYTNHYSRMGELATADPMRAFDGELHTFWADVAGERARSQMSSASASPSPASDPCNPTVENCRAGMGTPGGR